LPLPGAAVTAKQKAVVIGHETRMDGFMGDGRWDG
jgi:hypothetical protein